MKRRRTLQRYQFLAAVAEEMCQYNEDTSKATANIAERLELKYEMNLEGHEAMVADKTQRTVYPCVVCKMANHLAKKSTYESVQTRGLRARLCFCEKCGMFLHVMLLMEK